MLDWDARYAGDDYLYGEEPNEFLKSMKDRFRPGMRALAAADGEGRNGVWLAEQGLLVHSVDASATGVAKARRLAAKRGVAIEAEQADLVRWAWPFGRYDVVAAIFLHLPSDVRPMVHARMLEALKPGGLLVLEAFDKRQLQYHSGGPKDEDLLYTEAILAGDFAAAAVELLETRVIHLDESPKHRGDACVVRLVARRGSQ